MARFPKMISISFLVLLLGFFFFNSAFAAPQTTEEGHHYKKVSNISMTRFGSWTATDVQVPAGAILAITAEGEITVVRAQKKKRLVPSQCLKIRIGQDGLRRGLSRFYDDAHVRVFKNTSDGLLYYRIGRSPKGSEKNRGEITSTVFIWEAAHVGEVCSDLLDLTAANPEQKQVRALLFSLAECYTRMGDYSKSEMVLDKLRSMEGKQGREAAIANMKSSENEKWLRRYDRVKIYAEETLAICEREGYKGLQGEALLSLAEVSWHLGEREEAFRLAEQALGLSAQVRRGSWRLAGRAQQTLGFLSLWDHKPAESLQHLRSAVELLKKARNWSPLAQSFFQLGEAQQQLELGEEARKSYEAAVRIGGAVGKSETLWRAHSRLGRMAEGEEKKQEAFEHYAEAIQIIETMRSELGDSGLKAQFMQNKLQVYEWMIHLLLNMGQDEEAFRYLERAKARIMLDMLQEKSFSSKNREIRELLSKERSLREQLRELAAAPEEALPQESGEGEEDEEEPANAPAEKNQDLERVQSEMHSVVERIDQLDPELGSLISVNPVDAREVQALLDEQTALLAYFVGSNLNALFLVTKEKVKGIQLECSRKRISKSIKEFRTFTDEGVSLKLFQSREYEKPLSDLYEMLIKPVEKEISSKKHLVVVPHGMLHYLPFHALRSPQGTYLLESHSVSYLPSASVLKYARTKNRKNQQDFLVAANPVTDLAPLPSAEVEAREVSKFFKNKLVLLGPGATKSKVVSQAPRYDLLLFSTHGEMIESDPLRSNLRFTPSQGDDGKLTVGEIFDMEVKANLVTLSACETGLARGTAGDLPRGDDLVGLSRAFIHAGAPSVIGSLWQVSDDSTVAMMSSFFGNLKKMSKADALRQSQLELALSSAGTYSHPFFWAPFILVGDWE
jgi:CHAT domain-containing protein